MIDVDEICKKAEVYEDLRSDFVSLSSYLPPSEGLFDRSNFTGEIKNFLRKFQATGEEIEKFFGSLQAPQE
jgi:hypothetical protein